MCYFSSSLEEIKMKMLNILKSYIWTQQIGEQPIVIECAVIFNDKYSTWHGHRYSGYISSREWSQGSHPRRDYLK